MPGRRPFHPDLLRFLSARNGMSKTVPCPNCGKPVIWSPESEWRPFCSERCRLIDLGEWLDERHRISEPADSDAPTEHTGGLGPH